MSYSADPARAGMSMFDDVFAEPTAWAQFKRTDNGPDGTMLVLEARGAASHGSINLQGHDQADAMSAEIHVRDQTRFEGAWGFFSLDGAEVGKLINEQASCYACHQKNAAMDTTFVQFYPMAKAIALSARIMGRSALKGRIRPTCTVCTKERLGEMSHPPQAPRQSSKLAL